jgi:hypothetical protein
MARGVITMTTAPAGSGKSYRRGPHFLLTEFLPNQEGVHWSNLPLYAEKLAEEMARRTGKPAAEFLDRIKLVPPEVQQTWREGSSGPWEFFADMDLQNAHVALDEFHEFCGTNKSRHLREKYQFWFGQIRHRGATIEVISQSPEKIAREIHYEAGVQLSLVNSEDRRDPWFRILLGDWYELRAKFLTGKYQSAVWEIEERKAKGKWVQEDSRVFWLDAFYFQFYDSYSKPTDGNKKAIAQKREFEKRSALGLLWWFLKRNCFKLALRAAFVGFLLWFVCGGLTWAMKTSITVSNEMVAKSMKDAAEQAAAQQRAALGEPTRSNLPGVPAVPAALPRPKAYPDGTPTVGAAASMPSTQAAKGQAVWQAQLQDLRAQLEQERAQRQEADRRAQAATMVVLMTRESVTFRGGDTYRVGERVEGGALDGKTVRLIDWDRRQVVFDDGSSVRLGGGMETDSGKAAGEHAGVPPVGGDAGRMRESGGDQDRTAPPPPATLPAVLQPAE